MVPTASWPRTTGAIIFVSAAICIAVSCDDRSAKRGSGTGEGDRQGEHALSSATGAEEKLPSPSWKSSEPVIFAPSSAGDIRGFKHPVSNSRFARGTTLATNVRANGFIQETVGSDGMFITWGNGFTSGIPNAAAPSKSARPYAMRPEPHDQRVLAYFLASGLPREQVGSVRATASVQQTGSVADGPNPPELIGFTTVIHRQVDGLPVRGSFAWARFNANDDVVVEQVWWPDLPLAPVSEAKSLRSKLSDPVQSSAYRAKLPASLASVPGEVVVHHAGPFGHGWYAAATFDVAKQDEQEVRSFDSAGNEVHFGSQ